MLSREEVNELIVSPKIPKDGSSLLYDQARIKQIYELISQEDSNQRFKLDYSESNNVSLKLSCHHREFGNLGLVRIDYQGTRHENPQIITATVPNFLHPFAGLEIPPRKAHIHIYVEGSELKWAIPIQNYLELDSNQRFQLNVPEVLVEADKMRAIEDFARLINLQASFSFLGKLSLN